MALTNFPAFGLIDDRFLFPGNFGSTFLSQSNSGVAAFIMLAPNEQIDEIGVALVSVHSSRSIVVGVEGVSSSTQGNPDGTYADDGRGSATSGTVSCAGFSGGALNWIALTNPYRNGTSQPQMVALTLRTEGTGWTVHNGLSMNLALPPQATDQFFPYVASFEGGGSWSPSAGIPLLAARNALGEYVGGSNGIFRGDDSSTWDDTATTDLYRGNVWTVGSACRLTAVRFSVIPVDDGDIALRVYVNGALIANTELDEVNFSHVSGEMATSAGLLTIPIPPTVLEAGDVVRMVLEPLTSDGVGLPRIEFTSSSDRLAFTRGADIKYTDGSSTPSWNDDGTFIACISPVIDQIGSVASSAGGAGGGVSTKLSVRSGKESFIAQVFIPDSTSPSGAGLTDLAFNSGGLSAYYMRADLGAPVGFDSGAGTLNTMTIGTYADSGFVEIDDEKMPGWYQLGIPNAAFAAGAESVSIVLRGAPNMAQVNIEIAIDQEVTLAPRGFDSLGVPAFIDSEDEPVNEPVSTTLDTLTWPERIWYSSQWIVGGREDNRDLKKLTLLANDGLTTKASAEYTDAANVVNVPPMSLN